MFTDQPVTPTRLETLLDLIRARPAIRAGDAKALLQPSSVTPDAGRGASDWTIRAAKQLVLVHDDVDSLRLTNPTEASRTLILEAFDAHVLSKTDVEPYFASFYSFVLVQSAESLSSWTREDWAIEFNKVAYAGERKKNPFNKDKVSGLWRWFQYVGLGWFDQSEKFQPCPYERIRRQLPKVFGKARSLEIDPFMKKLAEACPELDGGDIFITSTGSLAPSPRTCTIGLGQALIELHLDGKIRLHAAPDSPGWSIEASDPHNDGNTLRGSRLDVVDWCEGR